MDNQLPRVLLVESLIYLLCQHHESDPVRQRTLYRQTCDWFTQRGLMGECWKLTSLDKIRHESANVIRQLFDQLDPNNNGVYPCRRRLSLPMRETKILAQRSAVRQDRYRVDFQDEVLIEKGGFGIVYKARHVLDNVEYAIKKIVFKVKTDINYVKVLREVQLYARLPYHPNVVVRHLAMTSGLL